MLPIDPRKIPVVYQEALALHREGKADAARERYQAILRANPKIPEAYYQLARLAVKKNDYKEAAANLDAALELKPNEPVIWRSYAELVISKRDRAEREALLSKLKKFNPNTKIRNEMQALLDPAQARQPPIGAADPEKIQAIMALLGRQELEKARKSALALLRQHSGNALIEHILGVIAANQGKVDQAKQYFRAAIAHAPNYAEAFSVYARLLVDTGDMDKAVTMASRAIDLDPKLAKAHESLGIGLADQAQTRRARSALEEAIKLDPKLIEARRHLGLLLTDMGEGEAATRELKTVMSMGDRRPITRVRLGQAQAAAGKDDAAIASYDAAIAEDASLVAAYAAKSSLYQELGNFEQARQLLENAIKLNPDAAGLYKSRGTIQKYTIEDPMIEVMKEKFADRSAPDESRIHFGFALSKAMEDTKQYDQVFAYLNPANALTKKRYPYDISERKRKIEGIISAYADEDIMGRDVSGASDYSPIFVTGMPRSGTTLVEQVIASHSTVTGGGEIGYFTKEYSAAANLENEGTRPLSDFSDRQIVDIGLASESRFAEEFGQGVRATDKAIGTYQSLGFMKLALPRAKVVVVRRDPRDNLLSIYKNEFKLGTHPYAYDLGDLGRYYRYFEKIVDFWREKLPGWFYEIQYEDLIGNPEEEARKLIAFCDLEWEDACLNFHENKRKVKTLSIHQVRQPIYSSSVSAWKRYEKDLQELFDALAEEV